MIINMTGGGGGANLNFDVKAYATEGALLAATPKENTIGIITTNKITGWMFSDADPAEPVEGVVYITTGTGGKIAFNALKKNGIMVYPMSAKQCVNGALVDVTAMIYQDVDWREWVAYISINETDWSRAIPYPSSNYSQGTYNISDNRLAGSVQDKYYSVAIVRQFDFSNIQQIEFNYSLDKDMSSYGHVLAIISRSNSDASSSNRVSNLLLTEVATDKPVVFDVSNVSGTYYLWLGLANWGLSSTVNFEISKLKFV